MSLRVPKITTAVRKAIVRIGLSRGIGPNTTPEGDIEVALQELVIVDVFCYLVINLTYSQGHSKPPSLYQHTISY